MEQVKHKWVDDQCTCQSPALDHNGLSYIVFNPISAFYVTTLSILCMYEFKPTSSQNGQQVDKRSKY